MSKVIAVLSALLVVSGFSTQAQKALSAPNTIPKNLTSSMARVITSLDVFNNPMAEETVIKGSPYLSDEYAAGNFYTEFGNFSGVDARYNIFYDQIEFKEKDSVFAIRPDQVIRRIEVGALTFVVDSYEFKGETILGYFTLIERGKIALMTKMEVVLRERQEPKPMQPDGLPARYDRMSDVYYYKIGDQPPVKIKSIPKMIDGLPSQKKQMEEFSKREKISTKNQEELVQFVRHYNSLKD